MLMGIKVKMYPNQKQQFQLSQMFGNDRFLWNQLVGMLRTRYHNNHKLPLLSKYDMQRLLKPFKIEHKFMKISDSSSLQIVCNQLHQSYMMFFKHQGGKPNFHSRYTTLKSYTGKSKLTILKRYYLKLPKLGVVKVNGLNQLQPNDIIKRYTVLKRPSGQYYLSLQLKRNVQKLPINKSQIGIDLGLHDLAITSDNVKYAKLNFKYLEKQIKQWSSKFNKRKHCTKLWIENYNHNHEDYQALELNDFHGWQKAKVRRAKLFQKLANRRQDILHKITTELVTNYGVIVIENLKSKNMMKDHHVAHAIANHAWYQFRLMLEYKCKKYGRQLIVVDPKNTSRICNICHQKNKQFNNLTSEQWLAVRKWTCPSCNFKLDRDVNAAQNILKRGLAQIS